MNNHHLARKLLIQSSLIFRFSNVKRVSLLRVAYPCYSSTSSERPQCKLVIFDKDGTLTCFDSMWAPWCEETAERLEKASGKTLSDVFYDFVNYDKKSQKFGRSKLAHDTNAVLKDQLAEILNKQHGINLDDANSFISYAWTDTFSTGDSHTNAVKPLGDVRTIFQTLKEYGIKVAVCTSDTRPSAKLALKSLGVADIVDRLVCGDDPDNTPKPAPDNVHMICKDLDVKVEDAVMIGDTHFDTVMGRDSKCGTVIGVLTGQVDESELDDAHYVVNSIDEALPILLKNSAK